MKDYKQTSISKNLLSKHNKSCILHAVWESKGISRVEIARNMNLSTATVSRLVDSLIKNDKLLEERETIAVSKGRPMKSLYFRKNERFIIGIDLGTTYIRGILTNMDAEPIKEIEVVTESLKEPEYVLDKVIDVIQRLSTSSMVNRDQILGIGIAVAGTVNLEQGVVVFSPAFQWRNVKCLEYIQSRIQLPLLFDNVNRVMALGELTFGKGNDYDNMICINVGYGIGAGIVINKKLFYGTDGMAGEFGHVPVIGDNLIVCHCGNKNCLTAYSSGDAIAQRARLMIKAKPSKILKKLCENNPEELTAKMVIEAARQNDEVSGIIFNHSIYQLGLAIAGLINTFNPQAIFIGGGIAQSGPIFWDPLKEIVQENVFDKLSTKYQILPVSFNDRAALYGAVGLVIKEVLNMDM